MTLEIDSRPPSSLHITVPPLADETGALPVVRTGRRRQPPRRGDGAGDAAHHLSRVIHRPATRTTAHHRRNPARLRHSSVQKARRGRLPAPGVKYHPGGAKTPGNTPWRPTGACWDAGPGPENRGVAAVPHRVHSNLLLTPRRGSRPLGPPADPPPCAGITHPRTR